MNQCCVAAVADDDRIVCRHRNNSPALLLLQTHTKPDVLEVQHENNIHNVAMFQRNECGNVISSTTTTIPQCAVREINCPQPNQLWRKNSSDYVCRSDCTTTTETQQITTTGHSRRSMALSALASYCGNHSLHNNRTVAAAWTGQCARSAFHAMHAMTFRKLNAQL